MLKLEIFLQVKSSQHREGERKANCQQSKPGLSQCFLVNIKLVRLVNDVPLLSRLVLVREWCWWDLGLQELTESLPALSQPEDQELGAGVITLGCRGAPPPPTSLQVPAGEGSLGGKRQQKKA